MSESRRPAGRDDERAARLALRAVGAAEEAALTERCARDPVFAERVERWRERFAGFEALVGEAEPPARVWEAIAAETFARRPDRNAGRLRAWQAAAAMAAFVAAAAIAGHVALFVADRRGDRPAAVTAPLLAAPLGAPDAAQLALATFDPRTNRLTVAPARAEVAARRVLELWFVRPDGRTVSLGLIEPNAATTLAVPDALAGLARDPGRLVVTLEPPGGAPGGIATGPAVAVGVLRSLPAD